MINVGFKSNANVKYTQKKIEILVEQASWKAIQKKETGKFAWLNECNNKITLSQISFFFCCCGLSDKIASVNPLCCMLFNRRKLVFTRLFSTRERLQIFFFCASSLSHHTKRYNFVGFFLICAYLKRSNNKKILIAIGDAARCIFSQLKRYT